MADEQDKDQKTEAPTGKKLQEARDSGQLPISREVGNWFLFAGILLVLGIMTPVLGANLLQSLKIFFEMPHQLRVGDSGLQRLMAQTLLSIAVPLLLIFAILLVASVAGTMVQTGFHASAEPIKFSWGKLSPLRGLKNIMSKSSLVELVKGILKLGLVGYVAYGLMRPYVNRVDLMIGRDLSDLGAVLQEEAFSLMLNIMFVVSMIAVIDIAYRRYDYYKSLRMTKQEVKDEMRQSEGDPMIKMRIRTIRMEKARKRMMAAVPKADVILTNPTHYAVALRYDTKKMAAPMVIAKGADLVALRIRDMALKSQVPIISNPTLARAIYQTAEVDQEISPQHYRAVAELISYVYKLKGKKLD